MIRRPRIPNKGATVWVTGLCNLNCSYCFYDHSLKTSMDDRILQATVNWVNRNQINKLSFYGGEPLTHPEGIKYLLAKTNCKSYGMTTNGTLLDDDMFLWLDLFRVGIALSFDGTQDTQDRHRDNSYDKIIENLPRLQALNANVLTTVFDVDSLYENVKHISDLGFKNIFLNPLNPYSDSKYKGKVEDFEEIYTKIILDFHKPPHFSINDFVKYAKIIEDRRKGKWGGCGINRKGQCIGPSGYIYPCHRSVEIGEEVAIGSVFTGIQPVRHDYIRKVAGKIPVKCRSCEAGLRCLPCPVNCYNYHKGFGEDPEDWYCDAIKTRYRVVRKLFSEEHFKLVNGRILRG